MYKEQQPLVKGSINLRIIHNEYLPLPKNDHAYFWASLYNFWMAKHKRKKKTNIKLQNFVPIFEM